MRTPFQDLSSSSIVTKHKVGLLVVFGLRGIEVCQMDMGFNSSWASGMTLGKLFIPSRHFFVAGVIIKYVKMPSAELIYSNSVPP